MSISSIISTATSALSVAQTRISVTSTNIANAETDGYTKKTANVTTTVVGGAATGAQVIGIGNDVDEKLFASVVKATSASGYDATAAAYLETMSSAFGSTDDGSDLSDAFDDLLSAMSAMISDPSATNAASDVTDALSSWADSVNDLSDSVQSSRTSADQSIAESVESVNDLLHQIDDLNDQIVKATANGTSTADLEDSRRTALESLSSYLGVTTFTTNSGALQIYTSSGQPLLTSTVHELSYTASGTLTADSTYESDGSGAISGIMVDGKDVTGSLTGGSIGALIDLRDETLPGVQDELDALSEAVKDAVNAASNAATAVPAPNSLTSSTTMAATDAFSGSGTMTILLTDSDGTITTSEDVDLSSCSTVQDVMDALNGISGVSASLDSDGHLVVAASDGTSGVIVTGDGTAGSDGDGVSQYFGFNDLITGDAGSLSVSANLDSQGLPTATIASTTVGDAAYASDNTEGLQAAWNALSDNMSFAAAGNLSATTSSPSAYIASLIDDISDRASAASDAADTSSATQSTLATSFSNAYGVNVDEETALLTTYQQDYEAAAQILSTAQDMWDSLISMMN